MVMRSFLDEEDDEEEFSGRAAAPGLPTLSLFPMIDVQDKQGKQDENSTNLMDHCILLAKASLVHPDAEDQDRLHDLSHEVKRRTTTNTPELI